jgi:hypothetical protein
VELAVELGEERLRQVEREEAADAEEEEGQPG